MLGRACQVGYPGLSPSLTFLVPKPLISSYSHLLRLSVDEDEYTTQSSHFQ